MEGWVSLHRKFLDWEWFDDVNLVKLFIYLLLKANFETKTWKGVEIKRGQLLTGLNKLNSETKISIQTLRTCLIKLERTQEINMQVTNKYRIITICNFDVYQPDKTPANKQTNKQLTSNQQTTNKQLTTTKEVKKEKKRKERKKKKAIVKKKINYSEFLFFHSEFERVWTEEFIPLKKKKKASISVEQLTKQLCKIRDFSRSDYKIALEILEKSVNSGWPDVYALKTNIQSKDKYKINNEIQNDPDRMKL